MKTTPIFIIIYLISIDAFSQSLNWAKQIDPTDTYHQQLSDLTTSNNNIYAIGWSKGSISFELNSVNQKTLASGFFLNKYSKTGDLVWIKSIPNNTTEYLSAKHNGAICLNSNEEIIVSGNLSKPYTFGEGVGSKVLDPSAFGQMDFDVYRSFLARYSNDGSFIDARIVASADQQDIVINNVTVDDDDNIWVTGIYTDSVFFDKGLATESFLTTTSYLPLSFTGVFVAKFDANLNFLFAKNFTGISTKNVYFNNVRMANRNGSISLAGSFSGTMEFKTANGLSTLTNATPTQDNTAVAPFIISLDYNGNAVWWKLAATQGNYLQSRDTFINDISGDDDGNIYVVGSTGGFNVFGAGGSKSTTIPYTANWCPYIAKFDSDGNFQWIKYSTFKVTTGSSYAAGRRISCSANGDCLIGGEYLSLELYPDASIKLVNSTYQMPSLFAILYDSTGKYLKHCNIKYNGTAYISGTPTNNVQGLTLIDRKNIIISGEFYESAIIGENFTNPITFAAKGAGSLGEGKTDDLFITSISLEPEPPPVVTELPNDERFLLYPNPASRWLYLNSSNWERLEIMDVNGKIIKSISNDSQKDYVDIDGIGKGLYLVKLRLHSSRIQVEKVLIE